MDSFVVRRPAPTVADKVATEQMEEMEKLKTGRAAAKRARPWLHWPQAKKQAV
jgi:hypothetical protein